MQDFNRYQSILKHYSQLDASMVVSINFKIKNFFALSSRKNSFFPPFVSNFSMDIKSYDIYDFVNRHSVDFPFLYNSHFYSITNSQTAQNYWEIIVLFFSSFISQRLSLAFSPNIGLTVCWLFVRSQRLELHLFILFQ